MDIACTVDQAYAFPFQVLLTSLLGSRRGDEAITFHVIDCGLRPSTRESIERSFAGEGVHFSWLVTTSKPDGAGVDSRRSRRMYYETLSMPKVLPQRVERVLYLDIDLLFVEPVEMLWRMDLDGCLLGAVQDMAIPTVSSPHGLRHYASLGLTPGAPYFNAGVMLIDLAGWRSEGVVERAEEYLLTGSARRSMAAQDAFNATVTNWKPLSLRWNVTASITGRPFFRAAGLDPVEYRQAVAAPSLLHFSGRVKPWRTRSGSRYASLYRDWSSRVSDPLRGDVLARDRWVGFYDRHLRDAFYRVERFVWDRRL